METEIREAALHFLEELINSGELKIESRERILKVSEMLEKEKISQEVENEIFKLIEALKKEYFRLGILFKKHFE